MMFHTFENITPNALHAEIVNKKAVIIFLSGQIKTISYGRSIQTFLAPYLLFTAICWTTIGNIQAIINNKGKHKTCQVN